jgi:hypothetical protein
MRVEFSVMPDLVPGIHVFAAGFTDVDGRDKPGHDENKQTPSFRDGPQDQTRNLELRRKIARQPLDSGFALRGPRNDAC